MIDLDWIIEQENELTNRARFDLGDSYHLSIDLLKLLQSIKSFDKDNEVSHIFNTQIILDFHLIVLNTIRRHTLLSNLLLRHALETTVLFAYSMVYKKESDYGVIKNEEGIIKDFDENVLNEKAFKYFEMRYSSYSKNIESYKHLINSMYSHGNAFSGNHNVAIIDGRLKALMFDNYFDDTIREILLNLNDIMIMIINLFIELKDEFNGYDFEDDFRVKFEEVEKRHVKLIEQFAIKFDESKTPAERIVLNIIEKMNKKYK